jgi:hypothetical protein
VFPESGEIIAAFGVRPRAEQQERTSYQPSALSFQFFLAENLGVASARKSE